MYIYLSIYLKFLGQTGYHHHPITNGMAHTSWVASTIYLVVRGVSPRANMQGGLICMPFPRLLAYFGYTRVSIYLSILGQTGYHHHPITDGTTRTSWVASTIAWYTSSTLTSRCFRPRTASDAGRTHLHATP